MASGIPQRGARVQSVALERPNELRVETYEPGARLRCWILSADPDHARWIETFAPKGALTATTDPPGSAFALLCRSRLEGGRCASFDLSAPQAPRLAIDTAEGTHKLVVDLHRPYPNVLLLDDGNRVEGAMRPASRSRLFEVGAALESLAPARPFVGGLRRIPPDTQEDARPLDSEWQERLAAGDLLRARAGAARTIRRELARLEGRLARLKTDEAAAAQAESFRRWGELLKIHGGQWRAGATELRVPDEFAEGRPHVAIPLDPALGLADNIAELFRRYRKRQRAAVHIERRMASTQRELADVQAAAKAAASATSAKAVDQAVSDMRGKGGTSDGNARTAQGQKGVLPRAPLKRISSDGLTILVGRSAQENDDLTFRIANGRDWWLHALGCPGSHVVVRHPAGGALPQRTLREAAWLAAYFSKARRQGHVEVGYVERKHVRRVPKGKPGQVTYAHGRTLWVNVGDAEPKRVLDSRGGDVPADTDAGEDP